MTAYDYNSSLTLKDIDYINVNEMKEPVFQRSGLCRVLPDQEDQDPELLSDQVCCGGSDGFGLYKTVCLASIPSESCHQSCRRRKSCRITARISPRSTTPTSGRRSSPRRAASTFPSRSTKDVSTCSCLVVFQTSANLGGKSVMGAQPGWGRYLEQSSQ